MNRLGRNRERNRIAEEYCRQHTMVLEGGGLSPKEVRQLERQLKWNPQDFEARLRLLGAYFRRADIRSREARSRHVMWVTEHRPGCAIAGTPYAHMDPQRDGNARFDAATELWERQAKKYAHDVQVLSNAANFFMVYRERTARHYLRRCIRLDPANYRWPMSLGLSYLIHRRGKNPRRFAACAHRYFEAALQLADPKEERYSVLGYTALAAYKSGDYEVARAHAAEQVRKPGGRSHWNYGNAVHDGNAVLGRIALKEGDVAAAKKHLLAAGKTPGSPQLNSFGPDMSLARELLELGEAEAVLEYLVACCRFWKRPVLEAWISEIQTGKTPTLKS